MNINTVAEKRKKYILERSKKGYQLARTLGFDSYEAGAVAQWSHKRIIALAQSRGLNGEKQADKG